MARESLASRPGCRLRNGEHVPTASYRAQEVGRSPLRIRPAAGGRTAARSNPRRSVSGRARCAGLSRRARQRSEPQRQDALALIRRRFCRACPRRRNSRCAPSLRASSLDEPQPQSSPKVMVPSATSETRRPLLPSKRYFTSGTSQVSTSSMRAFTIRGSPQVRRPRRPKVAGKSCRSASGIGST